MLRWCSTNARAVCFRSSSASSPTAATKARKPRRRRRSPAPGSSTSSIGLIPPSASRSYQNDGSSSGRWPGSAVAVAWHATSSATAEPSQPYRLAMIRIMRLLKEAQQQQRALLPVFEAGAGGVFWHTGPSREDPLQPLRADWPPHPQGSHQLHHTDLLMICLCGHVGYHRLARLIRTFIHGS